MPVRERGIRVPRVDGIERRELASTQSEFRFTNGPEIDGSFEGYLSIFDVTDSYGTRMRPGCWTAGGLDELALYPLLDMHSAESAVRSVLGGFKAKEDSKGLLISGSFAATQAGQDARTLAGMGFAPELSVGFVRIDAQSDDPNALISCRLVEGSLIIKGMASTPGAEMVTVRSAREERVWPPIEGSLEAKRQALYEALMGWATEKYGERTDENYYYVNVEATFDDTVVVSVEHYSAETEVQSFEFPYELNAAGEAALGEPKEVQVVTEIARSAQQAMITRDRARARLRLMSLPILTK